VEAADPAEAVRPAFQKSSPARPPRHL